MTASSPPSGSPPTSVPPEAPAYGGPSALSRFFLALGLSPKAFQLPFRRVDWLLPFLLVLAFTLVSSFILRDLFAAAQVDQAKQQIESNERLSAEQREEALDRITTGSAAGAMRWGPVIGAVVMVPLGALLAAVILMLILNFGMGGQTKLRDLWFLSILSYAPKTIGAILFTSVAMARSTIDVSFGPAALLPPDITPLKTFLRAFDLFEIWVFVIQLIGVGIVTGLPVKKARTGVVILWVIYLLFMLLTSLATGCMSGGMGARG